MVILVAHSSFCLSAKVEIIFFYLFHKIIQASIAMRIHISHLLSFLTLFESSVWALPAGPAPSDPGVEQQVIVRQLHTQPGEFS